MKKRFMSILLTLCIGMTLLPIMAFAAEHPETPFVPPDGWYLIEAHDPTVTGGVAGGNVIIGAEGAEMDVSAAYFEYYLQRYFYIQNVGNNQITLKTLDGKYLAYLTLSRTAQESGGRQSLCLERLHHDRHCFCQSRPHRGVY
jgi:hypothetical protein